MRKFLGVVVVLIIIGAIIGGTQKSKNSNSNGTSISLPNASSTPSSTPAVTQSAPNVPEPGPFHGSGAENLGTLKVPNNTVLHWTCPSCGQDNFIVDNSATDSGTIEVNSLDQTSGQTVVDGGTYHDVAVNTEGNNWTITFQHG